MSAIITIKLNHLRFFAYHGLYAEERQTGNEFEVNITLAYPAPDEVIQEIESTINYAAVYDLVQNRMQKPTPLLETLVMEIAAAIHTSFPQIMRIDVFIKKMDPPIKGFTGNVEVVYNNTF
ncbi:MAG: dihydroneopterin aldolase [Chitinophagaceae bacterium]|nr:dihydroneopterin aldolase [Chitinophagaceae bacterium]MBK8952906.1 dihydroneopterin aldolase [Chitinophagaceae bacterium]